MIYEKICAHCGKKFTSNRELIRYCSADCRKSARRLYQYEWNKAKRAKVSQQRKSNRSELSAARSAEIEERGRLSRDDFERRCAAGDVRALLIREKMLHGNSSQRYWELFAKCVIDESERSGTVSRMTVNGMSVYSDTFADDVMESVKERGSFVTESGKKPK